MNDRNFKLLNPQYIAQIKSEQVSSYINFLEDLKEDVQEGAESSYLSEDFQQELSKIVFKPELSSYTPLNYYWSYLIEDMIEHIGLLEDLNEDEELEDEMIDYLTHSEFAGAFLELHEENGTFETSKMILEMKELRAISFFYIQISKQAWQPNGPVSYQAVPELGDSESSLIIRDLTYSLNELGEFYPMFPVISFDPKVSTIEIEDDQDLVEICGQKNEHYITINNKHFFLMGNLVNNEIKERAEKAAHIIYKYHPDLFHLLSTFTSYIVPIDEEGIVSFSMENLPEYSSINMFERDFVDLVDDLVHENGHHYLNAHLSHQDLIIEDHDQVFYSPWRRAPRPIRGLYHAFFTFYWAFELFYTLYQKAQSEFKKEENEKILFRLCEEYFFLEACFDQLEKAYELSKITDEGMDLIKPIIHLLKQEKENVTKLESLLSSVKSERLQSLKNDILNSIQETI